MVNRRFSAGLSVALWWVDDHVDRREGVKPRNRRHIHFKAPVFSPVHDVNPTVAPLLVRVGSLRGSVREDIPGVDVHRVDCGLALFVDPEGSMVGVGWLMRGT